MIKVTSIEAAKLSFKLPSAVAITGHSLSSQDHIIVTLRSSDGLEGIGEASPFPAITGDSEEQVLKELRTIKPAALASFNTAEQFYKENVSKLLCASLRAALDAAAHDLEGKIKATPCNKLLRSHTYLVPNSVTVFLQDDPADSAKVASEFLQNHPHLKILKIKLCGNLDFERCAAIRSVCPDNMQYVLDANQGFKDPDHAVRELNRINRLLNNVLLIEEPCPKGDLAKLKFVTENLEGPLVFADESCCSLEDLRQIIDSRAAHGINIKLQKTGGITPARTLAHEAAAAGMKVMVGQMFESPLSTSAAVHFATAAEQVLMTDLDMDLPYPESLCAKSDFAEGCRHPLPGPGLGINLQPHSATTSRISWRKL